MKLFEYKEINHYHTDNFGEEELNKLGKEGWELVIVDNGTYIFKREMIRLPRAIVDQSRLEINPVTGEVKIK